MQLVNVLKMKNILLPMGYRLIFFIMIICSFSTKGQTISPSEIFEIRYFTRDTLANGETDFKGRRSWLDLQERIDFLHAYADYAANYFGDPELNTLIVKEEEIIEQMERWKPQPSTSIRKSINLSEWRALGFKEGKVEDKHLQLDYWSSFEGVAIKNGQLLMKDAEINHVLDSINWRFKLEFTVDKDYDDVFQLVLESENTKGVYLKINKEKVSFGGKIVKIPSLNGGGVQKLHVLIEGDLEENGFNCYINGQLTHDFIALEKGVSLLTQLNMISTGTVGVDNILMFNYIDERSDTIQPFRYTVVLDENFEIIPSISGWQKMDYDDSKWNVTKLPAVHGGIREQQESLYLRKVIYIDSFQRAILDIETLDQAGELWVNGEVVSVSKGRHPQQIDVTDYLIAGQKNLIAIRVKPYFSRAPMLHAPEDRNIGWFLGRTKLLLTPKSKISTAENYTFSISDTSAIQRHSITIQHDSRQRIKGNLVVNYYPWFPTEGEKISTSHRPVDIRPQINNTFNFDISIVHPKLWSHDTPNLYKVEVILTDSLGKPIDDFVYTTGIRTIKQEKGELLINNKPEMLNGAQVMGFRTPLETMAKYSRSAPIETIVKEFLALKKMGANMLRIHVHAEKDTTDGINDPRYAELADQLGIYLIWSTAGFIREGEAWNVDFDGYPKYMAQVINHPSIIIWEASNHPNRFKYHDATDTHDYIRKVYNTIANRDSSRLISPTSFWQHTHYANHEGTIDRDGSPIVAVSEFHAPLMTRGSQDAYSGYGAEWSKIRKLPNEWAASVLEGKDMAYFNFEHEESAAQPNWHLHRGKPWYKVQSYEWEYEVGSIGRKLGFEDWRASQAYQAFSAWESMKKQMLIGYDGFSWCTLEGGANMGTYQKPLLDNLGHPKLAYYINRMVFQRTWAASNNVDVVYGPKDLIAPVIHHIGNEKTVDLVITLRNKDGKPIDRRQYNKIPLRTGRDVYKLPPFQFKKANQGVYFVHYEVVEN